MSLAADNELKSKITALITSFNSAPANTHKFIGRADEDSVHKKIQLDELNLSALYE